MRDAFCQAMVDLAARSFRISHRRSGFHGARAAAARRSGRASSTPGVAEQNMVSVAAGHGAVGGESPGSTASRRSSTRGRSSRSATTSASTRCRSRWSATAAAMPTARWGRRTTLSRTTACCLRCPGMRAYRARVRRRLSPMVRAIAARDAPAYLRLGRCEAPRESRCPPYAAWRRLQQGGAADVGGGRTDGRRSVAAQRASCRSERPAIWVVSELDGVGAAAVPPRTARWLAAARSSASSRSMWPTAASGSNSCTPWRYSGRSLRRVVHAHAHGYPSGRYGSQRSIVSECGLESGHPATRSAESACRRELDATALARELQGPVLVLGASGFIGANLLRTLLESRSDVFGTAIAQPAWRLDGIARRSRHHGRLAGAGISRASRTACTGDGLRLRGLRRLFVRAGRRADVSDQRDVQAGADRGAARPRHRIATSTRAARRSTARCRGARGEPVPAPNSHYAVTKNAAAGLVYYSGKHRGLRCANLRLYSVYGPLEDRSRLIPTWWPRPPHTSAAVRRSGHFARFSLHRRCDTGLLDAAVLLRPGRTMANRSTWAAGRKPPSASSRSSRSGSFALDGEPQFSTMPARPWDVGDWYANPARAAEALGWHAEVALERGLERVRPAGMRSSPTWRSTSAPRRSGRSTASTA